MNSLESTKSYLNRFWRLYPTSNILIYMKTGPPVFQKPEVACTDVSSMFTMNSYDIDRHHGKLLK